MAAREGSKPRERYAARGLGVPCAMAAYEPPLLPYGKSDATMRFGKPMVEVWIGWQCDFCLAPTVLCRGESPILVGRCLADDGRQTLVWRKFQLAFSAVTRVPSPSG